MPSYSELNPNYTPPPGSHQNEGGYWLTPGGDFTEGEMTPGLWSDLQRGNDPRVQFDEQGRPFQIIKGQRDYFPPNSLASSTDPRVQAWMKTVEQPEGNFLHGYEWDGKSGGWKSNINGGNLLSAAIAGVGGAEALYPALSGLGAGSAGGAGAEAGGASVLPSTSTVSALGSLAPEVSASGAVPAALGGSAAAAAVPSAVTDATAAGAEAAPEAALPSTSIGSGMAELPAGAPSGAMTGADVLPSTQIGNGMSELPKGSPSGTMGSPPSTLSQVTDMLKNKRVSDLLRAAGKGTGEAAEAATQRRLASEPAFENRSVLEGRERNDALRDLYRATQMHNPTNSPYNPRPMTFDPNSSYAKGLSGVEQMQLARLPKMFQYGVEQLPDVKPSGLETAGGIIAPILTGVGAGTDILTDKDKARTPPIMDEGDNMGGNTTGGGTLTKAYDLLKKGKGIYDMMGGWF